MTGEPRGFSRAAVGFSSYDGEFSVPLVLAQAPFPGSPNSSDWAYKQLIIKCESPQHSYKILKENELNSVSGKVSKDFLVKML